LYLQDLYLQDLGGTINPLSLGAPVSCILNIRPVPFVVAVSAPRRLRPDCGEWLSFAETAG
jgi:hypothetical protein